MNNKIALIGDGHHGIRESALNMLDYQKKFYERIFFPYIDEHKIDTIIHLGDLVDKRKHINFIAANRLNEDFMKPIFNRKIDFHIICGNHDVFYKGTNEQNSIKQLYNPEIFPLNLYEQPKEVNIKGINFLMMPWICADNNEQTMELARTSNAEIVIAHLELAGFEMDRGNISYNGLDKKIFDRFPRVYSGHFHHKSSIENITYLGAPCQYSWIDYDDPKGFHVLDTNTKELTYIKNPYELFKKFFYNDKYKPTADDMLNFDENLFNGAYTKVVVKQKNDPYLFDMLISKIESASPADLQIMEDFSDIDTFSMDEIDEKQDTISILKKYITSTDSNIDKIKLEDFITNLYVEALNLER